MEAVIEPFVRRAVVSFGRGVSRSIDSPTWTEVEAMLRESEERGGRHADRGCAVEWSSSWPVSTWSARPRSSCSDESCAPPPVSNAARARGIVIRDVFGNVY